MSIKAPRLIRDRCGVYYFRLIVPLSWRNTVKKTEIRRSLRTKDVSIARQVALLLSAQMEAFMAGNKNAKTIPAIPEDLLSWPGADEVFKMRVRVFKNGEAHIEADTLEEAKEARAIVAELKKGNQGTVQEAMAALPSSRSGTNLEQAKDDYLVERSATLSEKGTIPKIRGVLKAFIAFAGNIDVAMVQPTLIKDYKKKLLAEKKAPTTINDHLVVLTGFF